jgi:hypothetical protein
VRPGGHFIFHDNLPAFPVFNYIAQELSFDPRVERVEFTPIGKYSTAVFRKR